MLLFKASGATYRRVTHREVHAFQHRPRDYHEGEFVVLSKNREDCQIGEQQVQYVGKLQGFRDATPAELDRLFPGVDASLRWHHIADLFWVCELDNRFDFHQVRGFDERHYRTVQGFATLAEADAHALLEYLRDTNGRLVLDFINNAVPRDAT
jgi:hypothetical protein